MNPSPLNPSYTRRNKAIVNATNKGRRKFPKNNTNMRKKVMKNTFFKRIHNIRNSRSNNSSHLFLQHVLNTMIVPNKFHKVSENTLNLTVSHIIREIQSKISINDSFLTLHFTVRGPEFYTHDNRVLFTGSGYDYLIPMHEFSNIYFYFKDGLYYIDYKDKHLATFTPFDEDILWDMHDSIFSVMAVMCDFVLGMENIKLPLKHFIGFTIPLMHYIP
jgi:hypothetical protein